MYSVTHISQRSKIAPAREGHYSPSLHTVRPQRAVPQRRCHAGTLKGTRHPAILLQAEKRNFTLVLIKHDGPPDGESRGWAIVRDLGAATGNPGLVQCDGTGILFEEPNPTGRHREPPKRPNWVLWANTRNPTPDLILSL